MEILIIGIVVVALMVFISTKIKRSAAEAFERETVETEAFKITKPEGFINPIRENSEYAFEAYSKEFGEKSERNVWKAQTYLTISEGLNFESVCETAKQQADKVLSEKISENKTDGERICLIESEKTDDEADYYELRKIVESKRRNKTYDLKILVLQAFRDELAGEIGELVESFTAN